MSLVYKVAHSWNLSVTAAAIVMTIITYAMDIIMVELFPACTGYAGQLSLMYTRSRGI